MMTEVVKSLGSLIQLRVCGTLPYNKLRSQHLIDHTQLGTLDLFLVLLPATNLSVINVV